MAQGAQGDRHDRILTAACEVIARRGYHQASVREIARAAGLSLAGLYHHVEGKDALLHLVLERALGRLAASLDAALAGAPTPERRLLALIRTHLAFGFHHARELRVINRDWALLPEPRRTAIAARREAYLARGLAVLRELDPRGRPDAALRSATNLLLGMLNGIATRPFLRSPADARALADEVGALFLHGFLAAGAHRDGAAVARRTA
jgi:AcrR family transcriptional regulator